MSLGLLGGDGEVRTGFQRFKSHDGTSIAFRVSGEGSPVVLVHGFAVTSTLNFATHFRAGKAGGVSPGDAPTIEDAVVDAGLQAVMLDLRGFGHSERSHDPAAYTMSAYVDDVRTLARHLEIERAALVGYSFGSLIATRMLHDRWVSAAALCGAGSGYVEGVNPQLFADLVPIAKCLTEGCWDEYPEFAFIRAFAELDPSADFTAIARAALGFEPTPREMLDAPTMPVVVINGGADLGAQPDRDLAALIPGARRIVAGAADHGTAPSDPEFQAELVKFLLGTAPSSRHA